MRRRQDSGPAPRTVLHVRTGRFAAAHCSDTVPDLVFTTAIGRL